MMRVHEQGFVKLPDHQDAMHPNVPVALQADVPLLTFPLNLFRWAWIVFQARQKRLYNWWCAFVACDDDELNINPPTPCQ